MKFSAFKPSSTRAAWAPTHGRAFRPRRPSAGLGAVAVLAPAVARRSGHRTPPCVAAARARARQKPRTKGMVTSRCCRSRGVGHRNRKQGFAKRSKTWSTQDEDGRQKRRRNHGRVRSRPLIQRSVFMANPSTTMALGTLCCLLKVSHGHAWTSDRGVFHGVYFAHLVFILL